MEFKERQKVVCISDDFPAVHTTGDKYEIGKMPNTHPIVGCTYIIDEILGDFIRFNEFDCDDPNSPEYGYKWWHHSRFEPYNATNEYAGHVLESVFLNN